MKIKTGRDLFTASTRVFLGEGGVGGKFLPSFFSSPSALALAFARCRMVKNKKSMDRPVVLATCLTVLLRHMIAR